MDYDITSFWVAFVILLMLFPFGPIVYYRSRSQDLQRTIDRQNDTIQRLINREPVTYKETGQTPQKPERIGYAAWGAQTFNIDEDERQ